MTTLKEKMAANPGVSVVSPNADFSQPTKLSLIDQNPVDNTGKFDPNDPSVPAWVKAGFGDTPDGIAAYNQIYQPVPGGPGAMTSAPNGATTPDNTYVGDDPFATYLRDNPGRGDAWSYVQSLLDSYGVGSLSQFAKDEIINGRSASEIALDMMNQQAFKDRFPVIEQMKKAGLPAWSPGEIVSYEKTVTGILQSSGLPKGFYDDPASDIQKFILHGVSANEVEDRVINGYVAVMQQPQDVRDQWYALGYTTGDMVAHFLDPDTTEALLTKQKAATERAAEAMRAGYGQLSTAEADWMAGAGISSGQSSQGFNKLVHDQSLYSPIIGEQSGVNRQEQLAATFGNDANAQAKIQKVADSRKAVFSEGGEFTGGGKDGRTGVGSAL